MSKRIYMVEDEHSLNILLQRYLENEGYEVTTFFDGNSASEHIVELPDMWILDIMLPDIDGYELINRIKSYNQKTPVLFMSARNDELDRVTGLELGSDDYLSKPFLPRELVIRVNRLMEHIYRDSNDNDKIIMVNTYEINLHERNVKDNAIDIPLTKNEFELLLYFYRNKNIALTREQILTNMWGIDYFGSDRVVDDTIRRIRKKMDKLKLETVHGYGYKLVVKYNEI